MAATIGERERALLEAPNFCHVATLREDGSVHGVLVWVGLEGDRIVLNSNTTRDWPRNLERDPRITLTIPSSENPYEFVSVRGTAAERTTDGADEHIDALAKKYLDADAYPFRQPGEQRIKIYVEPEYLKVQGG